MIARATARDRPTIYEAALRATSRREGNGVYCRTIPCGRPGYHDILNEVSTNLTLPCNHEGAIALSNFHTSGPGPNSNNGSAANNNSFVSRREIRASNVTGALPIISVGRGGYAPGTFDFEAMLVSLHDLFEQDRQMASQPDAHRCGVCYLHYSSTDLYYREEGFYVCKGCEQSLGRQSMPMLRHQQK